MSKAAATRLGMLQKAFELIYKKGYRATSIDEIIATTEVTKGAFFYHFKNKDEMGLAMIEEVIYPGMYQDLVTPLRVAKDPIEALYTMMQQVLLQAPFFQIQHGCPAVNLIEEMAPINASFHQALSKLILQWQEAIQACISQGILAGTVSKEVNPKQVASFIIAGYSGIRNMGKILGPACYQEYLRELKCYLKALT